MVAIAKNASATSSGFPSRASALVLSKELKCCGSCRHIRSVRGVRIVPGATTLVRILQAPRGATSAFINPSNPALAAEYAGIPQPLRALNEDVNVSERSE